jgi:hypothetical protein
MDDTGGIERIESEILLPLRFGRRRRRRLAQIINLDLHRDCNHALTGR